MADDNEAWVLCSRINIARERYYTSTDAIPDADYDAMVARLKCLAAKHPDDGGVWVTARTVLSGVGYTPTSKLIPYVYPMTSLRFVPITNTSAIQKFFAKHSPLIAQYKYDGVSAEARYIDGTLTVLLTRGNSQIGENITRHIDAINGLPRRIGNTATLYVRGELIVEREIAQKLGYKTPRSAATGLVNGTKSRNGLTFIPWYVIGPKRDGDITDLFATEPAFNIAFATVSDYDEFISLFTITQEQRMTIPFDIDGMVLKDRNVSTHDINSTHDPKWALAVKFPSKQAITTVLRIEWKVAKSGRVNPTAVLEPVDVDGITISRASLKNIKFIQSNGIGVGASVMVVRAQDVIPDITDVIEPAVVELPERCPMCNTPLSSDDTFLWCTNMACQSRIVKTNTRPRQTNIQTRLM